MNRSHSDVLKIATLRHNALQQIRKHFDPKGFIEIDAPILIRANAVEAFIDPITAQPFDLNGRPRAPHFLITSPEIHMKRLLAHGAQRIYFLGHVFRDREDSPIHSTEFMMLEWYETGVELEHLIAGCETLFRDLCQILTGGHTIRQSDHSILDFSQPFDRVSVASAWEQFAHIDLGKSLAEIALGDRDALTKAVCATGESLRENADFDDAFTHIMVKKIEPQIGKTRPCVLFDWPAQTAALARLSATNPLFAQRFEIYCGGLELANAFAELTDPVEQRARFIEANETRAANGKSTLPIDEDFIRDLGKMPPACGIAVGIDRLIVLICGKKSLQEVQVLVQ